MKFSIIRIFSAVKTLLMLAVHEVAQFSRATHVAVFTWSLFMSTQVMAQGVTGFFRGWQSGIGEAINLLLLFGVAAGIASVMYGLFKLVKKGGSRGEDVEAREWAFPILGGALLSILLWVIRTVVTEGGAGESDIGNRNVPSR